MPPDANNLYGLTPGETYTLSGSVSHTAGELKFRSQYSTDGSTWIDLSAPSDLGIPVSDGSAFTSFSHTFTVPNKATGIYISLQNYDYTAGSLFRFKNMKLEKGSVATNWCLSQSELTTTTRSYRGVTLNDRGLTATAGGTTVAMNSNDGFLINNLKDASADNPGGQVFHVDTDGNLTISGSLTSSATISGANFTGQYLTLSGSLKLTNEDSSAITSKDGEVVFNSYGISATSGPITVNINGTNPLLIQNNNNDIFKVDTDGNLAIKGDLSAGDSPNSTISGVNFTGDNLTLTGSLKVDGQILFANGNGVLSSQGLSLKGGGLSISDSQGNQTTYIKSDGTFTTNKGYFEGDITAHQLILDSSTSSINMGGGVFQVDSKGNVIANSFTSNNVKITGGAFSTGAISSSSISGGTITGATITGNTIVGGTVKGNEIVSSKFYSTKRESAIGTYYPISNSVYTPSFFVNDDGTISFHTTFPRSLSLATGISKPNDPKDNVGPVFKINEAFDRNTLAGSIGYGKGYDYPVPYLYGQQGGMPSYPIDSDELSIVWLNDVTKDTLLKQTYCDNYRYTQIASVSGITSDYKSKVGRIKINFDIVNSYGSYDVDGDTTAGGIHDLILVLTTGPINEGDLYHVDPQMAYFNNMNNDIKIKMVSKKILTDATGHAYYNLYGELSTQDLGPADTYYLGVLQQGFVKSEKEDSDRTWKIQIDNLDVVPDSTFDSDQSYYMPRVGGSYRELAISPNGSIITQMSRGLVNDTSEYNADYITFSSSVAHHQPYWTTISSDGIGFSIGDNSASQDGAGHNS